MSSSSCCFTSCISQLDCHCHRGEIKKTNTEINLPRKISEDDFELFHLVGQGSFGKVFQVRKKNGIDNNKIYAMKVIDKEQLIKTGKIYMHRERNILVRIKHPFIVELFYILQNSAHIFYVLEYLCGGELLTILRNHKVFSEDAASFYIKEIVLALEHLHLQEIVYRDLKPSNILLDIQGHVKIIDFGLSKENMGDGRFTFTSCGSPSYCAPEVALGDGHGTRADWWSTGVLFYVMVVGKKPFRVTKATFSQVDYSNYVMPENLTPEAKSLIMGLLEIHQIKRLGTSGPNRIKKHKFFKDTNWDEVLLRKEKPPFLPPICNISDVSQYDSKFTNLETNTSCLKNTFHCDNLFFKEFSYVCPSLLQEHATDLVTKEMSNLNF